MGVSTMPMTESSYWVTCATFPPLYFFTRLLMRRWILQGAEHLTAPIHITPSRASKSAIRAVEKQGGTVVCRYYNRLSLYDCVKGRTDRIDAAPTRRQDIRMYILFRTSIACTEMIFSKNGTPIGKIAVTWHRRVLPRCPSCRNGGDNYLSS